MHLREESSRDDGVYEKAKVLCLSEENVDRLLFVWENVKINDVGVSVNELDKTNDELVRRVCEIYRRFLDACYDTKDWRTTDLGFASHQKDEFTKKVGTTGEDLSILIYSPHPTVEEYCQIFIDDDELALEDELAFPQPAYLSEYMMFEEEPFFKYNGFKG